MDQAIQSKGGKCLTGLKTRSNYMMPTENTF